jgi:prepilin-type N-terminal cleavage/methylation domain-containing protein
MRIHRSIINKINIKISSGFTLAEVLITLLVIGVVSSLVIPVIMADFDKHSTVTRLQKVYAVLQQAVKLAQSDYGDISTWNFPQTHLNGNDALQFANTYLMPYLNVSKNCGTSTGCWANPKSLSGWVFPSSVNIETSGKYANFILNDGTTVSVSDLPNYADTNYYINILVDINGQQSPNTIGKDVFSFMIIPKGLPRYNTGVGDTVYNSTRPGLYADGWGETRARLFSGGYAPWRGCSTTANSSYYVGAYCTTVILYDQWQIKSDYPW